MNIKLKIGDQAYFSRTISESDVYNYASVTADNNLLSMNEAYYKECGFEKNVVQNSYLLGLISASLGAKMPGFGTIYLEQETEFLLPIFQGDTVIIHLKVIDITQKSKFCVAKITVQCLNQKNELVAKGIATVIPPSV